MARAKARDDSMAYVESDDDGIVPPSDEEENRTYKHQLRQRDSSSGSDDQGSFDASGKGDGMDVHGVMAADEEEEEEEEEEVEEVAEAPLKLKPSRARQPPTPIASPAKPPPQPKATSSTKQKSIIKTSIEPLPIEPTTSKNKRDANKILDANLGEDWYDKGLRGSEGVEPLWENKAGGRDANSEDFHRGVRWIYESQCVGLKTQDKRWEKLESTLNKLRVFYDLDTLVPKKLRAWGEDARINPAGFAKLLDTITESNNKHDKRKGSASPEDPRPTKAARKSQSNAVASSSREGAGASRLVQRDDPRYRRWESADGQVEMTRRRKARTSNQHKTSVAHATGSTSFKANSAASSHRTRNLDPFQLEGDKPGKRSDKGARSGGQGLNGGELMFEDFPCNEPIQAQPTVLENMTAEWASSSQPANACNVRLPASVTNGMNLRFCLLDALQKPLVLVQGETKMLLWFDMDDEIQAGTLTQLTSIINNRGGTKDTAIPTIAEPVGGALVDLIVKESLSVWQVGHSNEKDESSKQSIQRVDNVFFGHTSTIDVEPASPSPIEWVTGVPKVISVGGQGYGLLLRSGSGDEGTQVAVLQSGESTIIHPNGLTAYIPLSANQSISLRSCYMANSLEDVVAANDNQPKAGTRHDLEAILAALKVEWLGGMAGAKAESDGAKLESTMEGSAAVDDGDRTAAHERKRQSMLTARTHLLNAIVQGSLMRMFKSVGMPWDTEEEIEMIM